MVAAAHTTYQHYPSFFIIFRDDFGYIAIALKRNFNQASQRKVVHKSPQISRCLIGLCCFNPCYQNIMTRSGLYCQFWFRFFSGDFKERPRWLVIMTGIISWVWTRIRILLSVCYPEAWFKCHTDPLTTDWDGSDDARDSEMMSRNVSRVMSWRVTCDACESWDDGIIGMCWLPLHMPSLSIGESPETMKRWGLWACVHPVTIIGRCVTRDGHPHTSHYMSRKVPQKLTSVHFRITNSDAKFER